MAMRPSETDTEFRRYANRAAAAFNADFIYSADEFACAACNTYLRDKVYRSDVAVIELIRGILDAIGSKRNAATLSSLLDHLNTSGGDELDLPEGDYFFDELEPVISEETRRALRRLGGQSGDKYFRRADFELMRNMRYYVDYVHAGSRRILDLGAGAGFFSYYCSRNGHEVCSIDAADCPKVYDRSFEVLGLEKIHFSIAPGQPLLKLSARYDLVAAFQICFNGHGTQNLWGPDEWRYFLRHLGRDVLTSDGSVLLSFNYEFSNPNVDRDEGRFGNLGVEQLFEPYMVGDPDQRVCRLTLGQCEAL
ncbi:MAG: class I SAM-dependent methyltransferase [Rhodospirillales bacterium]